jgi:hypothetical protein
VLNTRSGGNSSGLSGRVGGSREDVLCNSRERKSHTQEGSKMFYSKNSFTAKNLL